MPNLVRITLSVIKLNKQGYLPVMLALQQSRYGVISSFHIFWPKFPHQLNIPVMTYLNPFEVKAGKIAKIIVLVYCRKINTKNINRQEK